MNKINKREIGFLLSTSKATFLASTPGQQLFELSQLQKVRTKEFDLQIELLDIFKCIFYFYTFLPFSFAHIYFIKKL